jgi:hypothetical protein
VAAKGECKIEISQKIRNHIAHALFSGDRGPPGIKPSQENGPGTQSQCLENIGAAANATVK